MSVLTKPLPVYKKFNKPVTEHAILVVDTQEIADDLATACLMWNNSKRTSLQFIGWLDDHGTGIQHGMSRSLNLQIGAPYQHHRYKGNDTFDAETQTGIYDYRSCCYDIKVGDYYPKPVVATISQATPVPVAPVQNELPTDERCPVCDALDHPLVAFVIDMVMSHNEVSLDEVRYIFNVAGSTAVLTIDIQDS